MMQEEISQIKDQYNQKLTQAVQKLNSEKELTNHKNAIVRQFELVLNHEFEKILLSLKMKS